MKRASAKECAIVLGVAYDKQRLERGLSTTNAAVVLASAVLEADRIASEHPKDCACDKCKGVVVEAELLPDMLPEESK
jgi:hypothetical protein